MNYLGMSDAGFIVVVNQVRRCKNIMSISKPTYPQGELETHSS